MTQAAPHNVAGSAAAPCLPQPRQLAALGTVLCLHRPQAGGELAGWAQAVRAQTRCGLDSDGLREHLLFYDRDDRCCWCLSLLPDSDFLAWEQLATTLPRQDDIAHGAGIGERLWWRLAGRMRGERWQASVLRLHALRCSPGFGFSEQPVLAASLAPLSTLGAAAARRIARDEGAEGEAFVDECCCRQAALAASQAALANSRQTEEVFPLIRLNLRGHA